MPFSFAAFYIRFDRRKNIERIYKSKCDIILKERKEKGTNQLKGLTNINCSNLIFFANQNITNLKRVSFIKILFELMR